MILDDPYAPYYTYETAISVPNHNTYTYYTFGTGINVQIYNTYIYNNTVYISKYTLSESDLNILDQLKTSLSASGVITVELANIIAHKFKEFHIIGDFNTINIQSTIHVISNDLIQTTSTHKFVFTNTTDKLKYDLINFYQENNQYCYFIDNYICVTTNPISYDKLKQYYEIDKLPQIIRTITELLHLPYIEYEIPDLDDLQTAYVHFNSKYDTFVNSHTLYIIVSQSISELFKYIEQHNFANQSIEDFTADEQRLFLIKYQHINRIDYITNNGPPYYQFSLQNNYSA